MNNLAVTEYGSVRVLTTQQLAEAYGTSVDTITRNFNRNKDRYSEGKHYIALEGEEKNDFLNLGQFDRGLRNAKTLYLWTEKGAFLHAKSLNTDVAWEVYDHLVDTYFSVRKPLTQLEILQQSIEILNRHDHEIRQIDSRIDRLEHDVPLYGSEADEICNHVKRKGVEMLGGKQCNAYKDSKIRSAVYTDIYNQIKREFGLYDSAGRFKSYKALQRKYIYEAHELIDCYELPMYLKERVDMCNAQLVLDVSA